MIAAHLDEALVVVDKYCVGESEIDACDKFKERWNKSGRRKGTSQRCELRSTSPD